jgi:hypothetical protein
MVTVSVFQHVRYTSDKDKTKVVFVHGMTAYEGVEHQLHAFLTKALYRGGTSVSRPCLLNLGETVLGITELESGCIQSRSGPFKEKINCCPCKESNHSSSISQLMP